MKKQKILLIIFIILTVVFAATTLVFISREIKRTSDPLGVDCMPTVDRGSYEILKDFCLSNGGCYCASY